MGNNEADDVQTIEQNKTVINLRQLYRERWMPRGYVYINSSLYRERWMPRGYVYLFFINASFQSVCLHPST